MAISAFSPAQTICRRDLHKGCSLEVKGQTTTVSRYLFISSWLIITTGRIFLISLPMVGLRSAKKISYLLGVNIAILQSIKECHIKIIPAFIFAGHRFVGIGP